MTLTQALHRSLQLEPQRLMTIQGGRTRTVSESVDRVSRLAGALKRLGLARDERLGILALNSDRYHEVLLATLWADGCINPVNTRWSPAEIAFSLEDCATHLLVVDDAFAPMVDRLRAQAPCVRTVVFCGDGPTPHGMENVEDLIAGSDPEPDARRGPDELLGIFYTGGTTGTPKGVMLTQRACLTSAMGSLVTTDFIGRGGVLLHAAPMFHLADLSLWVLGLLTGSTHVMVPSFTSAAMIEAVRAHSVTDTMLVPTMIQALVDALEADDSVLPSMQHIVYGASPISDTLLQRARARFAGARFTQAYGMTELSPVATVLTAEEHGDPSLARSAGRAAVHTELRIVDPLGQELPRGETGEIVAKGEHVMQGYWNRPQETEAALRDGWMHTGDLGYMDDRGYLFVIDRLKDMIITGGENVYSVEVENALVRLEGVAQAAVVGVPDPDWGERVHAYVIPAPGHDLTLDDLREGCRHLIAGYKLPRSFEILEAFPLSGAGKILKRELRTQAARSA